MRFRGNQIRFRIQQMFWWVLGAAVFVVGAVYAISVVPGILVVQNAGGDINALSTAEKVKAVTDARQGVILAVGGFIAIVTLLFARAKHILEADKQALEQDSNWTDRYTEAVKQLGDQAVAIRLGGIYALERIYEDSSRDRKTIVNLLCAYLREKSSASFDGTGAILPMSIDAMAAAQVLSRTSKLPNLFNGHDFTYKLNLRGTNLTGANFSHARLDAADFRGANLSEATFERAVMRNADLSGASLREANFSGATLTSADLSSSDLSHSKLARAKVRGAKLHDAVLSGASLFEADLTGADLSRATLIGTELGDARLDGTILGDADLTDAKNTHEQKEINEPLESTFHRYMSRTVTLQNLKARGAQGVNTVKGLSAEELETPLRPGTTPWM